MSTSRTRGSEHGERRGRSLRSRGINFAGHWLLAGAVFAAAAVSHLVGGGDPVRTPFVVLGEAACTALVAVLAWGIGMEAKRKPLIVWHTVGTIVGVGVAVIVTTIVGFAETTLWLMAFGCATAAATWNLRRLDALRSETREADTEDSIGKTIGLAKTKAGRPVVHPSRIEVPLHHQGGETVADAQSALPKVEALAHTIPGRSRVVADPDNAAKSNLVLVTHDALKDWTPWPGPSHPGGSFADPTVVGVYEDGVVEKYWHVAAPAAPGKDSRPASGVGRQGMTRSGKTGNALVAIVDGVLTRRDVVLFYADCTKGGQSIGPLRGGVTLYADTNPKVTALFRGVEQMILDRSGRLGEHGFRDWSPACFTHPDLRMPAVLFHMDEADDFINTERFTKLCKAGLSTGVYMSVTLPRADHISIPTGARAAISIWLCFGVKDDDNTAGFALDEATIAAGAHPEKWGATKQGYHYLDQAPGVDSTRWPVPARSYAAEFPQLAAAVADGAPYRASLPDYDIASLGIAWQACQLHQIAPAGPTPDGPVPAETEDEEMPTMPLPETDDPAEARADAAMYAQLDPAQPIEPAPDGDGIDFAGDLPEAPSPEVAEQAFNDLLKRMAMVENRTDIKVDELVKRFPYRSRSTISRRLSAMAEGEILAPPGIALERGERAGQYVLSLLVPAGVGSGNGNGGSS